MRDKKRVITITFAVLVCSLLSVTAVANSYRWNVADGYWNVGSNWDLGSPPTSSDYAYINNDGTARIDQNAYSRYLYVGQSNSGTVVQTDGTNTISYYLYICYNAGTIGTYNLDAGDLSVQSDEHIGHSGAGVFNQDGGTHRISGALRVGYNSGSSGTYNLSAGELAVSSAIIGYYGKGIFNQTGGSYEIDGTLSLWGFGSEESEYTFTGGSLEAGDLFINNGWMDIDISEIEFFHVMGNKVDLLDGYIADDKIFDSTFTGDIWAAYDSENDWTTLITSEQEAVPEPGTIALLAAGTLGMIGVIRKRIR